jgi:Terpene cyclase DEP1
LLTFNWQRLLPNYHEPLVSPETSITSDQPPGILHALRLALRIRGFFGLDVIVSAFVLIPFVLAEGSRLTMKQLWAPVVGTLLVGVSFGLPLFLLMREPYLKQPNEAL